MWQWPGQEAHGKTAAFKDEDGGRGVPSFRNPGGASKWHTRVFYLLELACTDLELEIWCMRDNRLVLPICTMTLFQVWEVCAALIESISLSVR